MSFQFKNILKKAAVTTRHGCAINFSDMLNLRPVANGSVPIRRNLKKYIGLV